MPFVPFGDWLKRRVDEDAAQSGVNADTPAQVTAPTDPKEIQRRKAVSNITGDMMKKKLKPGGETAQVVAGLSAQNVAMQKADPETQQAVSAFFLKK